MACRPAPDCVGCVCWRRRAASRCASSTSNRPARKRRMPRESRRRRCRCGGTATSTSRGCGRMRKRGARPPARLRTLSGYGRRSRVRLRAEPAATVCVRSRGGCRLVRADRAASSRGAVRSFRRGDVGRTRLQHSIGRVAVAPDAVRISLLPCGVRGRAVHRVAAGYVRLRADASDAARPRRHRLFRDDQAAVERHDAVPPPSIPLARSGWHRGDRCVDRSNGGRRRCCARTHRSRARRTADRRVRRRRWRSDRRTASRGGDGGNVGTPAALVCALGRAPRPIARAR